MSMQNNESESEKGLNKQEEPEKDKKSGLKKLVREFFMCTVQALLLTLVIVNFVGRISVVMGSSMKPSLKHNNRILVNLVAYRFHKPERGDIIIFQCPINPEKDYIKRVIALPGEKLQIKEGKVFINGKKIEEPYLKEIDRDEAVPKITIPKGHVYVMGDNRINSEDSRLWGPLDCKLIKGKAQLIFWPPKSFQGLK